MFTMIYFLFNDAVSSSDYLASNRSMMISISENGKDVEGSGRGLIRGTEENHNKPK
jgi:hypothetical protein